MSERAGQDRRDAGRLMSVSDTRMLFKLGRTAAYELTRRPGFPAPVQLSRRCLRWWASEVDAYAETLQREGAQRRTRTTTPRQANSPGGSPGRYEPPAASPGSRRDRARVLRGAEDADEGGIRDADVVARKGPAAGVAAGPWW